jgi:hypothetical protein
LAVSILLAAALLAAVKPIEAIRQRRAEKAARVIIVPDELSA